MRAKIVEIRCLCTDIVTNREKAVGYPSLDRKIHFAYNKGEHSRSERMPRKRKAALPCPERSGNFGGEYERAENLLYQ